MRSAALLLLSGLSCACVLPGAALVEPASVERASPRDPYGDFITEAAQRFELPATWIRAVLRAESDGDPRALSPKGAIGLMQVMPETWNDLRVRHRLGSDPYDPHDNIIAGTAYIRELFDRYGSPGWIAAYNAGPGRFEASLRGVPLPAETRAYVANVAPAIDSGETTNGGVIAAADPFSWTRAPLFIAQADRTSATSSVSGEHRPSDGPAAPSPHDMSGIAPQSSGLFVARVSPGDRP